MLRRALFALLAVALAAASASAALTLDARAERHVRESHFAGGRLSRGKSLFLPGTDLLELLKLAEKAKPARQKNGRDKRVAGAGDPMAPYVRLYNEEVDAMMGVLVPPASYRKEHYAYGRFVCPEPHGLHTDHSLEDPAAAGEPICIARIETLESTA